MIQRIIAMMVGDELKEKSRNSEKDFTRKRKIGFFPLICLIIRMIRKSTQLELDELRERLMPEEAKTTTYTKQSFSEVRQKLSPVAFALLNDDLIRAFYEDGDFKTYNEFRLFAMDGSVMELPNTKETQAAYGYCCPSKEGCRMALALSSHLYDVENKLAISTCLSRYDDNERDLAKRNVEHLLSLGQTAIRNLILFDRGYRRLPHCPKPAATLSGIPGAACPYGSRTLWRNKAGLESRPPAPPPPPSSRCPAAAASPCPAGFS